MGEFISQGNRRGAYRVEPADPDDIDLAVLGRRQRIFPAEIGDLAVGGARVRLVGDATMPVDTGDRVGVAINSKRHNYDHELAARVVVSRKEGGAHIVHLSFLGDTQDLNDPPPGVYEMLNRRSTYRGFEPKSDAEFNAFVTPLRGAAAATRPYPVVVRNISNSGVSLGLDRPAHDALEGCSGLTLTIELPGRAAPTSIACHIRHRSDTGEDHVYGCEYDWSDTSDSLGVVEDLAAWLLENFNGRRSA